MIDSANPAEIAVQVEDLTMKFGDFIAVDRISFEVRKGEVFGFLGPNGAGKSTTIRMLCGIIRPTSGDGKIGGYSIRRENDSIKLITGYMSQKFSLYHDLTPYENLEFYSGVYGLSESGRRERIQWALEMSNLTERKDDLTGNLPVGFQQRLALGAAILHEPSVLFLDEPTAGVDPLSRRRFWELIYDLSSSGVTVFVTTHYMDEAEHCDRIAFINRGKLIRLDSPTALKHTDSAEKIYEITSENWRTVFDLLRRNRENFGPVSLFGTAVHISMIPDKKDALAAFFARNNISDLSIMEIAPSLEDVFISNLRSGQGEGNDR